MRALRAEHHCTADDVAEAARRFGLRWQRSTVASIETGKRGLSAEELLMLPLVMTQALSEVTEEVIDVSLGYLLDVEAELSDGVEMLPQGAHELLAQKPVTTGRRGGFRFPKLVAEVLEKLDPGGKGRADDRRIGQLWPDVHGDVTINFDHLFAVKRAASGEAEQKAARRLGVPGLDIAAASFRLWGHGLTQERDSRAGDNATRRGHITRALVEEIREVLREVEDG